MTLTGAGRTFVYFDAVFVDTFLPAQRCGNPSSFSGFLSVTRIPFIFDDAHRSFIASNTRSQTGRPRVARGSQEIIILERFFFFLHQFNIRAQSYHRKLSCARFEQSTDSSERCRFWSDFPQIRGKRSRELYMTCLTVLKSILATLPEYGLELFHLIRTWTNTNFSLDPFLRRA